MIPVTNSFITSFFTALRMVGFNFFCCYLTGLKSSSKSIRCMHMEGFIPGRSTSVHPMAFLRPFKTCSNLSSCSSERMLDMMTGSFWGSSKYAYLRCSGNGFRSKEGGWMVEGKGRKIGRSKPAPTSQSEWITKEISAQILHTIADSSESSQVQSKEPRLKS